MLLARLTEVNGAPGQEGEVRNLIRAEVEPYVDEIRTDSLGNLYAIKNAGAPGRTVMHCHARCPYGRSGTHDHRD